jgi:hypothetical protein
MVQRYSVSLYDEEIYQEDDGTYVDYSDYAALEQRFDALSSKFAALVEENAALEKLCGDLDNLHVPSRRIRGRLGFGMAEMV